MTKVVKETDKKKRWNERKFQKLNLLGWFGLATGNAFVGGKNPPAGIMFDIMDNGAL